MSFQREDKAPAGKKKIVAGFIRRLFPSFPGRARCNSFHLSFEWPPQPVRGSLQSRANCTVLQLQPFQLDIEPPQVLRFCFLLLFVCDAMFPLTILNNGTAFGSYGGTFSTFPLECCIIAITDVLMNN